MLHLPTSHDCPACGGVHRPTRAELPAAAELRPYFGTYTPSKFPRALWTVDQALGNVGPILRGVWTTASGSATTPSTGQYDLGAECLCTGASANDAIDFATIRIQDNGNPILTSPNGHRIATNTPSQHSVQGRAILSSGHTLTVAISHSADAAGTTATFTSVVLHAAFVPTPTQPQ